MNIQEFHKKMKLHFGIKKPQEFLDELFLPQRKVVINLMKFDDWLHNNVGEYENRGFNMEEALTLKFGNVAASFIKSLI